MTRMNWDRGKHVGGYSIERSPYRPYTASDLLRGRVQHRPKQEAHAVPAPMTLRALTSHGINGLAVWCSACRLSEHRDLGGISAATENLPLDQLGSAVRCAQCDGPTMVTPFRSQVRCNVAR